MDLRRLIRDHLRDTFDRAEGQTNVAISANIGTSGHSTVVYSDDDVTIIERDGEREMIRRHEGAQPGADPDETEEGAPPAG